GAFLGDAVLLGGEACNGFGSLAVSGHGESPKGVPSHMGAAWPVRKRVAGSGTGSCTSGLSRELLPTGGQIKARGSSCFCGKGSQADGLGWDSPSRRRPKRRR